MDIILQKRTRNGETVFDIDTVTSAYLMGDELIDEIKSQISDNLVPFVKPVGQMNSDYQYYVDGNPNDIFTIDILDICDFANYGCWLLKGCKRNDNALNKLPLYFKAKAITNVEWSDRKENGYA